ncbi:hypothetical protein BGW38_005043 [Lunasporangiospora selenospora]|uniref:Uncharacterized protein n=1 Tax=Lunasporangiospora selenospora TaxID=979761 RepID=A0A9P6KI61_9FUNG|nr:hypothetical protein BGW38_005043 [Lunasporangiospora selenospora]
MFNLTQTASKAVPFTPLQVLWIPGTNRICSLGSNEFGSGVLQVHAHTTSSGGTSSPRLILQSEAEKRTQFKSGTFRVPTRSTSSPQLLTGDFEGRIGVWNLARTEIPLSTFRAHNDVVNCMDGAGAASGRPEFITGCRDGTIRLWDMRQDHNRASSIPDIAIRSMSGSSKSLSCDVWSVAVAGQSESVEDMMIVAGYDNGDVRVIDLRMCAVLFETNVGHGVCSVEFYYGGNSPKNLIASTLHGALHSFDVMTGKSSSQWQADNLAEEIIQLQSGDDSTLWQARHVPQQSSLVAVTDGGGNVFLLNRNKDKGPLTLQKSHKFARSGIISMDFNADLEGLFVASDLDNTIRTGIIDCK